MAYIGNAPYQGSVAGTNILDGTIETVDLKDGNVTGAKLETLAGLTSGTYGNSTAIPAITIDVKGRVTAISTTAVSIPSGSISVTGGDLTLSGSTGTAITNATLASVGTAGTYTKITTDAKGRVTSGTTLASGDLPTYTGTLTSSQITTALGFTPENIANKGAANGYASLDSSGKVPSAQLPSYVDDVLEYANLAAFPATGSGGIIYVTQDTNKTYRWTGSAYVEISPSPGTTDSLTEGSTNLYYTNARARASLNFTAGSGAYNSTTGAITIPTNTTHLTNGSGYITGNQTVTLSGDASGSGATAITVTLANSGVTAGTYNNVTVDAKGRVTSGSNTSYLTSYTETDTLATVTGRGNSTSNNFGSSGGTTLNFVTSGNTGTWIGGISDGTSGWGLSRAVIGFKSDDTTYAAIGIGTSNGLLYFGRTNASGAGTMSSWLEVNSSGVANFKLARPQYNGSNLALVSEIPSISGYLTAESDTLATVTGRGASTSTAITINNTITSSSTIQATNGRIALRDDSIENWATANDSAGIAVNYYGYSSGTSYYRDFTVYDGKGGLRFKTYGSGNYSYASGSMRAPIFYDSDDTNYYVNPASTSTLSRLSLAGGAGGTNAGLTVTSIANSTGPIVAKSRNYTTVWSILPWGDGGTYISSGTYYDNGSWVHASSDSTNCLLLLKGSGPTWYSSNDGATTWNLASGASLWQNDGRWINNVTSPSDVRAPIFYDSNNTNYYVDPNNTGTSGVFAGQLVVGDGIRTATSGFSSPYNLFALSDTYDGGTYYGIKYVEGSPDTIQIIGANTVGLSIGMDVGDTTASSSLRAPIFYDSNDTGYYCNPNSVSRLYRTESYYFRNIYTTSTDHPFGLYFDSGESTAYAIYRESGAWTHPYPDLRIAFHTGIKLGANAGYQGIRFYTDYDMSSQVMSVNNGSDGLGANNVYVNNSLQAGSSLRAPIFYDSDNTGYYIDPASTSNFNALNVGGSAVLTTGNYTSYISSGSEPTFSAFDGLPIGTS
jgi:hypothetical protein